MLRNIWVFHGTRGLGGSRAGATVPRARGRPTRRESKRANHEVRARRITSLFRAIRESRRPRIQACSRRDPPMGGFLSSHPPRSGIVPRGVAAPDPRDATPAARDALAVSSDRALTSSVPEPRSLFPGSRRVPPDCRVSVRWRFQPPRARRSPRPPSSRRPSPRPRSGSSAPPTAATANASARCDTATPAWRSTSPTTASGSTAIPRCADGTSAPCRVTPSRATPPTSATIPSRRSKTSSFASVTFPRMPCGSPAPRVARCATAAPPSLASDANATRLSFAPRTPAARTTERRQSPRLSRAPTTTPARAASAWAPRKSPR